MVHRAVRGGVEDRWYKRVRQPDGSYVEAPSAKHGLAARWRARYVTDEGKETEKVFAVKREAEAWLRARLADVDAGAHIPRSKTAITVADVHKEWSRGQAHIAKSTAIQRASTWKVYVEPKWGGKPVGVIKTSAVRAWIAEMVAGETGVPSIENAHGLLRMILDAAVEDGRLPRNPAAGIKLPKRTHPDRGYLSHLQLRELAEHCEDDGLVVLTLGYTGLRWPEMSALRVQDVDLERRPINVSRAVVEASKLDWKTPKSHERRSVPFPQALTALLADQVKGRAREDLVFTNTRGTVLRVGTWRNRVFRPTLARCRAADPTFPTITPHDLRHTAASLAISAGANVLGGPTDARALEGVDDARRAQRPLRQRPRCRSGEPRRRHNRARLRSRRRRRPRRDFLRDRSLITSRSGGIVDHLPALIRTEPRP
ncbi:tyrosine-type recombinase/integrase [Tsukamurella tyrosinosolvens]|uniref:tyrosine-type recombinase/integrase n=1 Tax=Tsukamurella tyrosinosolvens TaxID=57704 RepID=UPI001FCFD95D|nr:tyrosine-type recombinase/integrase [Tsukamurella tyrosinosolvens]